MDNKKVERFANRLQISLNEIEEVFLKGDKPFLCGDNITIADLLGSCEVEQPRCVGYDVYAGHPKVKAWMERVRSELHPYYDEAHVVSYKLLEKFGNAKL